MTEEILIMRRGEIKVAAGINDATFNNYLIQGIIMVDKDPGGRERDYSPHSIPRVITTRKLTSLGYSISDVVKLMSKCSTQDIDGKIGTLPAGRLKGWVQQILKEK